MIFNQVGPPVRGHNCFGRDQFADLLWEKLSGGHVLLASPRRFGKTSVMYKLLDRPRWDYRVVMADLEDLAEPAEFVTCLVERIARHPQLGRLVRDLSSLPRVVWSAFRGSVEEVELHKVRVRLREQLRPHWREIGDELFRKLAGTTHTTVFLLDEFPMMIDRMSRSGIHREEARTLLRWLRAVRQSPDFGHLRFVIAGSIGIGAILSQLGEISAINDVEQVRLEAFSPETAMAFLDELSKAHRLPLSPRASRTILRLIGVLTPYFIQVLFSELHKAQVQDKLTITPKLIERVYNDKVLGVDCKTYFDHYYGRLRQYYPSAEEKAIKRLLRELAAVGRLTEEICYQLVRAEIVDANPERFRRLMVELENDFYIRADPRAGTYEFACNILRDWWLRHYGMSNAI